MEHNCTCTNCIFIDGGRRYCYDCEKYTNMPSKEELERKIEEKFRNRPHRFGNGCTLEDKEQT